MPDDRDRCLSSYIYVFIGSDPIGVGSAACPPLLDDSSAADGMSIFRSFTASTVHGFTGTPATAHRQAGCERANNMLEHHRRDCRGGLAVPTASVVRFLEIQDEPRDEHRGDSARRLVCSACPVDEKLDSRLYQHEDAARAVQLGGYLRAGE